MLIYGTQNGLSTVLWTCAHVELLSALPHSRRQRNQHDVFSDLTHNTCVCLQEAHPNDCGVLAVRFRIKASVAQDPAQAEIECAAVHYSKSMGIGWCSRACPLPECQVLRQQLSEAGEQRLVCTGCFASCGLPGYQ